MRWCNTRLSDRTRFTRWPLRALGTVGARVPLGAKRATITRNTRDTALSLDARHAAIPGLTDQAPLALYPSHAPLTLSATGSFIALPSGGTRFTLGTCSAC